MRKVGIYVYDLTIQSLFLQLFEKENLKEKNKLEGFEKERKKKHILRILEQILEYSIQGVRIYSLVLGQKTLGFFKKKNAPYETGFYLLQDDYIYIFILYTSTITTSYKDA